MRCPKCGYISFDKVTSCSKCKTDVTEIANTLNGTGFKPMDHFFLGTLLPDFVNNLNGEAPSLHDAASDLNISVDDLENLDEIGAIPGETGSLDLGLGNLDSENTISLQGVVVPELDLDDFDDGFDNIDTMQISPKQLDAAKNQNDDATEIDLSGIDLSLGEEESTEAAGKDLADLDLSDLDLSNNNDNPKDKDLPDLEL